MLCIFWLAVFPASGATQIRTPPQSLPTYSIYSKRGSVLCCLHSAAKFTSELFTLKTTDENLTVCTTDSSIPTPSNQSREESIPLGFCTYPVPTSLPMISGRAPTNQSQHLTATPPVFPRWGDFNIVNTSSPSYAVQSSSQAMRSMCSGVLKPTTNMPSVPPFGKETPSLHGF